MLDKLELQPITVLDDYQATMLNEKEVLLTTKVTDTQLKSKIAEVQSLCTIDLS